MKILGGVVFCTVFFQSLFSMSIDVGQRFILSLPRTDNFELLDTWLAKTKPAGVMLEAWHTADRKKAKVIINHLQHKVQELGLPPLFITIDLEGGIVSRFNESGGFFSVPSPYNLAKAGRSACFLAGMLIGEQLRSIGANVDFAPLLDLFDENNYVLATRCFSSDPQKVAVYAEAFAKGLANRGIMPVAKHFPGLGLGNKDTHLEGISIDLRDDVFEQHSYPFNVLLEHEIAAVMVSHAEYERFGVGPASQSKKVIEFLRKKNPHVLCITDDIAMKAFRHAETLLEDVETSLKAGFHLLIYSDTYNRQIAFLEKLREHIKGNDISEHKQLVEEINTYKKNYIQCSIDKNIKIDEKKLSYELAQKSLRQRIYLGDVVDKKVALISVDLPKFRSTEQWFTTKQPHLLARVVNHIKRSFFKSSCATDRSTYLGRLMRTHIHDFDEFICDPTDRKSVEVVEKLIEESMQKYDFVFVQTFFYGQGVWNDTQLEWLKILKQLGNKLVVFSLGHPYEKNVLSKSTHIFELGSFHNPMVKAAWESLQRKPLTTGADYLLQNPDKYLKNKRFGLLCNQASRAMINGEEVFLPDALAEWAQQQKDTTKLSALFCPEHGLLGTHEAGAEVDSELVSRWGCPIFSLHGKIRKPTASMVEGLDTLVIDLQEVGVRCFTYISTMALVLELVALENKEVIILDRPNPLKIWDAQGPMLQPDCVSFLGQVQIPFLHGKTLGGVALDINKQIQSSLVVLGDAWSSLQSDDYFIVHFKKPSPNLMSAETLFIYPMTIFIEGTNYSEGRGTFYPFQQIGAPWVDGVAFAKDMNNKKLPGVYFEPVEFTPQTIADVAENPKHEHKVCGGVFIHVIDKSCVKPMEVAQQLLEKLFELYPTQSQFIKMGNSYMLDLLVGDKTWRQHITSAVS